VNFAVQNDHIYENKHISHVFPNIKKKNYNVLFHQDIMIVHQDRFLGNNQLNFFASSAIKQIDYFVPGSMLIPQVRPAHKYPNSPWEIIHTPLGR
jgi:hypothetical protein